MALAYNSSIAYGDSSYFFDGVPNFVDLVVASSSQASASSTGPTAQHHALVGTAVSQSAASLTGAVTQIQNPVVDNSSQANASATGIVSQAQVLVSPSSSQDNAAASGALISAISISLVAANSTQPSASSTGAITLDHVLIHAPSVQDSIAAASPIVQTYILAAANATQNAYPQNVIVTQTQQLLGTGCAQQPFSGVGAIRASFISSEDIAAIASAVWANTTGTAMTIKLAEIWGRLGLDASKPLVTGNTSITFGEIAMAMSESAGSVTVTRK